MAAELHVTPSRATDADGLNLSGAKWYFYQTGTSTLQSVFTTSALSVAHTNPVVADAAGKFAPIYFDSTIVYRGVLKTSDDATVIYDIDPINAGALSQLASSGGAALVKNVLPAGSNLRTHTLAELANSSVLQLCQFSGASEEAQLVNALTEATTTRDGGQGQTVLIPRGEIEVTAPFNVPNRAALIGVNKRGSRIVADAAFSGSYMVTVDNGTLSMFDNRLAHLALDCNNVAGIGGIDSQAWQEGGGLDHVLIQSFRTYGLRIREMEGGAALCNISDSEIFGSTSGCTAGVLLDDPSLSGAFQLNIRNTTIAGGNLPASMPRAIDVQGGSLFITACHVETCETGIYLDGSGNHVIVGFNGGSGVALVTNLIEIAATFTGSVTLFGCQRNGSTNFIKDNRAGGFGTIAYDIPYLRIASEPPLYNGAIVAAVTLNGTGTPAVTKGFGVTGVTDNGPGDYTLTLIRSASSAGDYVVHGNQNASGWVRCDLNGTNTVRVRCYDATGTLADQNEIHVSVIRAA